MRAASAESTNKTAITIVAMKRVRSKPRRVWDAPPKLSDPPKAPPAFASDCCSKIATTKRTDRVIWMYGRRVEITVIELQYTGCF